MGQKATAGFGQTRPNPANRTYQIRSRELPVDFDPVGVENRIDLDASDHCTARRSKWNQPRGEISSQ